MEIVIGWIVVSAMVAVWADKRGRSGIGYFFLALLLSPIIASVVLLVAGDKRAMDAAEAARAWAQRNEHERHIESIKAIAATATSTQQVPVVSAELERLAALRDKGVLTQEEFSEQKRRLLAARP